jgi:hypothetical protein
MGFLIMEGQDFAHDTIVSIVQAAAHKAQMVHNALGTSCPCGCHSGDELWSFVEKNEATPLGNTL